MSSASQTISPRGNGRGAPRGNVRPVSSTHRRPSRTHLQPRNAQRRVRKFRGEGREASRPRALRMAGRLLSHPPGSTNRRPGRPLLGRVALLNRVLSCDPAKLLRLAPSTRNRLLAHAYALAGYGSNR